jgi:hypothetical protein
MVTGAVSSEVCTNLAGVSSQKGYKEKSSTGIFGHTLVGSGTSAMGFGSHAGAIGCGM